MSIVFAVLDMLLTDAPISSAGHGSRRGAARAARRQRGGMRGSTAARSRRAALPSLLPPPSSLLLTIHAHPRPSKPIKDSNHTCFHMSPLLAAWRHHGVLGLLALTMGITVPSRLGTALRLVWTLLVVTRHFLYPTAMLLGTRRSAITAHRAQMLTPSFLLLLLLLLHIPLHLPLHLLLLLLGTALGRTPSAQRLPTFFNSALSVVSGLLFLLLALPANKHTTAAVRAAAPPQSPPIAGHLLGAAYLLIVPLMTAYRTLTTARDGALSAAWIHRISADYAVLVHAGSYAVSFAVLVLILHALMAAARASAAAARQQPSDGAVVYAVAGDVEAILRYVLGCIALAVTISVTGLVLFLLLIPPLDSPPALFNLLLTIGGSCLFAIVWLRTLRRHAAALCRAEGGKDVWEDDAGSVEMAGIDMDLDVHQEDEDGRGGRRRGRRAPLLAPRSTFAIVLRAATISLLMTAVVLSVLIPWTLVAGPPSALDKTDFWARNAAMYKGQPATIVATLLFSPLYALGVPLLFVSAAPFSTWPRHLVFPGLLPGQISVMALHAMLPALSSAIVTPLTTAIVMVVLLVTHFWLRKVRPRWTFTSPMLFTIFCGALFVMALGYLAFPAYARASDTGRVVIRLSVELASSLFQVTQKRLMRKHLSIEQGAKRPYVAYAMVAPVSLIGRLMVVGVDDLVSQAFVLVLLAGMQLGSVALSPMGTFLISGGLSRDSKTRVRAVHETEDILRSPLTARAVVIKMMVEYTGIALSAILVIVHAFMWHGSRNHAALLLRLGLSVLIQVLVEVGLDLVLVRVRQTQHDLRFHAAFANSMAMLAVMCTGAGIYVAAVSRDLLSLVRDIVLAE